MRGESPSPLPASEGSRHSLACGPRHSGPRPVWSHGLCASVSPLLPLMRTPAIRFRAPRITQDDLISRSLTSLHLQRPFFLFKYDHIHRFWVDMSFGGHHSTHSIMVPNIFRGHKTARSLSPLPALPGFSFVAPVVTCFLVYLCVCGPSLCSNGRFRRQARPCLLCELSYPQPLGQGPVHSRCSKYLLNE